MTDINEIRARRAACADLPWSCACLSGEQLDALLEEVERLRVKRVPVAPSGIVHPFDLDAYNAWRRDHPTQPLYRDVESWMVLEIVQLREELELLQQEARIRQNLCDRFAAEWEQERAAVVAFLRDLPSVMLDEASVRIERGEHRREEER